MDRIPVRWNIGPYAKGGNSYGYATAIERTRAALEPHVEFRDDAPVTLTFCTPHFFQPLPGRNVLMTMFESPELPSICPDKKWGWESAKDLPGRCIDRVAMADAIVTPSRWCRSIFLRSGRPVDVVPLGVDPFPYRQRTFSRPFRWLWLGAFNVRKGWQAVTLAWDKYVAQLGDAVELYIKTTPLTIGDSGSVEYHKKGNNGRLIFDTRNVDREELGRIYDSAHGFLFPSIGEGFGLTAGEALSSGLPVIASDYSGHRDFLTPRNSTLLPVVMAQIACEERRGEESDAPHGKYTYGVVGPRLLAAAMLDMMRNYEPAVARAAEGARYLRERFTWERTGRELAAVLRREVERAGQRSAA